MCEVQGVAGAHRPPGAFQGYPALTADAAEVWRQAGSPGGHALLGMAYDEEGQKRAPAVRGIGSHAMNSGVPDVSPGAVGWEAPRFACCRSPGFSAPNTRLPPMVCAGSSGGNFPGDPFVA